MRYPTQRPNKYRDLIIEAIAVLLVLLLWEFVMALPAI